MTIMNLPPATYEASRSRHLFVSNLLNSNYCFEYIILQSLSLCIFTKISWSTINFKTENGSRLITVTGQIYIQVIFFKLSQLLTT